MNLRTVPSSLFCCLYRLFTIGHTDTRFLSFFRSVSRGVFHRKKNTRCPLMCFFMFLSPGLSYDELSLLCESKVRTKHLIHAFFCRKSFVREKLMAVLFHYLRIQFLSLRHFLKSLRILTLEIFMMLDGKKGELRRRVLVAHVQAFHWQENTELND